MSFKVATVADAHASGELRRQGVERIQRGRHATARGDAGAIEDVDLGTAALFCTYSNVGLAVAVEIAGRHVHAAGEGRGRGVEAGELEAVPAAGDGDLRSTAGIGPHDDIGVAVAIDVAGRHPDTAGQLGGQGLKVHDALEGLAVEDGDFGPTAGAGAADDVGRAVTVDVGDGDADTAGEARGEGNDAGDELAVNRIVDVDTVGPHRDQPRLR